MKKVPQDLLFKRAGKCPHCGDNQQYIAFDRGKCQDCGEALSFDMLDKEKLDELEDFNPVDEKNNIDNVVVTDIKMPFISMVEFMVKWAIASIPALIILFFISAFLLSLIGFSISN